MKKINLSPITRSGHLHFSLPVTAVAAVTLTILLLTIPTCALSAEPQLDWYADEAEAIPAPPSAGQGAKGQTCAGSIVLDKYTVYNQETVTVEVRIPALWRDEIDFVTIKGKTSGTAVSMGGGLYVYHDKAPSRHENIDSVKVTFLAMKGTETVCTGTTSYTVAVLKKLSVSLSSSKDSLSTGEEVTFTGVVSASDYSANEPAPTPPIVFTWNLGGESRTITRNATTDTQSKSFSFKGWRDLTLTVVDAQGLSGSGWTGVIVYNRDLSLAIGGPLALNVGESGRWTAEASGGTPPYRYDLYCATSGWTLGQSCSRAFDTPGQYYLSFRAHDSDLSYGFTTISVHVREPLAVSLSCVSQAEVGKDAICTATVSGGTGLNDYTFNWGDGGKTTFAGVDSTSQAAGHIYNSAGTYAVTVSVKDGAGQSATGSTSISVVLTGCAADEKVCGGQCWPDFWTCCGNSACPPGYPCCGNGCCAPGGWCVREGFCCKDGYQPCPDGKSCCTSIDRCNPSGGCL